MHSNCQGFISDIDVGLWTVVQSGLHTLLWSNHHWQMVAYNLQFQLKFRKASQPELLHSNGYPRLFFQQSPFNLSLCGFSLSILPSAKASSTIHTRWFLNLYLQPLSWICVGDPLLLLPAWQYLPTVTRPAQSRSNILHGLKLFQGLCL